MTGLRIAALVAALLGAALPARAEDTVVFAAASLKTALDAIAADWQAQTGDRVLVSYAGTPVLARQIAQGAPAHIFVSASVDWMDVVEAGGHVVAGTRRDLVANRLVLIAAAGSLAASDRELGATALAPVVEAARAGVAAALALAFTEAVPAGIYAREALTSLGVWDAVAPGVVETENVRAALALVARGEVPYGIVYASDAAAEPRVVTIGRFAPVLHAPIVYPAALVDGAPPRARAFLDHLFGEDAWAVFAAEGFVRPGPRP